MGEGLEQRGMRPLSSPERAFSVANLPKAVDEIKRWATEQGLRGATARDLFEGYCRRLEAHGFTLMCAYVSTRTLHPQWTGHGYTWRRETLDTVRAQAGEIAGKTADEALFLHHRLFRANVGQISTGCSGALASSRHTSAGGVKVTQARRYAARPSSKSRPRGNGERLVWLERSVVNRLRSIRGPGESYIDVILQLVAT
jgi:hypothetical protein